MQEIPRIEKALVREFMRADPPDAKHHRQTTTGYRLIQHHGSPTRLLDWSYPPFVAPFFGLVLC
jgi:hypothetical protein